MNGLISPVTSFLRPIPCDIGGADMTCFTLTGQGADRWRYLPPGGSAVGRR